MKMGTGRLSGRSDRSYNSTGFDLIVQLDFYRLEVSIDAFPPACVLDDYVVSVNCVISGKGNRAGGAGGNGRSPGSGEVYPVMEDEVAGNRVFPYAEARGDDPDGKGKPEGRGKEKGAYGAVKAESGMQWTGRFA